MEDTYGNNNCEYEHGLSLYIETQKHHILFDTGASSKILDNAKALKIDLTKVDIVVLSHGHYDHAGGILAFSQLNPQATIYMQSHVDGEYYHGDKYIGINKEIMNLPQIRILNGDFKIDDELLIYSHIKGRRLFAKSNLELSKRIGHTVIPDIFDHEQCLVIFQENKKLLLSGCAHNGILNILDRYYEIFNEYPHMVISGFHMSKKIEYTNQEITDIKNIAEELNQMDTVFYTGHCTGLKAYHIMKNIMKNKLIYIHSGDRIV